MTNCFDLLPGKLFDIELWDIGCILLLLSSFIYLNPIKTYIRSREFYIKVYKVFIYWMLICFAWSIFIYEYDVLLTIKASRQMILGYLLLFIFLSVFEKKESTAKTIYSIFFYVTLLLMLLYTFQYHFEKQIFYGYYRETLEGIRSIPIFIHLIVFYLISIVSKALLRHGTSALEKVYGLLGVYSILLTFTRGIYLAFMMILLLLILLLIWEQKRKGVYLSSIVASIAAVFAVMVLYGNLSTSDNKYLSLIMSGIEDISGKDHQLNTFNLRTRILEERMDMVSAQNSFIGYGFIHEQIAYETLLFSVGTYNREIKRIAFASSDIAWANLLIYTGYVGVVLFTIIPIGLITNYMKIIRMQDKELAMMMRSSLLAIVYLIILMMDSNVFTSNMQIPALFIAFYTFCARRFRLKEVQYASQ